MANLAAINAATTLPVYRPLIGMDKEEIIAVAKKAGTFEVSLEAYKDCCSLVSSTNPKTRTKIEQIEAAAKSMDMDAIVQKTIVKIEYAYIGPSGVERKWLLLA